MTEKLETAVMIILSLAAIYIGAAFIASDLDFRNWHQGGRIVVVFAALVAVIYISLNKKY